MSNAARSKPSSSLRRKVIVAYQELWLERTTRKCLWVDLC